MRKEDFNHNLPPVQKPEPWGNALTNYYRKHIGLENLNDFIGKQNDKYFPNRKQEKILDKMFSPTDGLHGSGKINL